MFYEDEDVKQIQNLLFDETGEKVTPYGIRFIIDEYMRIKWREKLGSNKRVRKSDD